MNAPEWIVPGTEVLVYNVRSTGQLNEETPGRRLTNIKSVAIKSFTVDDEREPRFRLDDQTSSDLTKGGIWTRSRFRRVVPVDSPEAVRVLAIVHRQQAMAKARNAVHVWLADRTKDNRLAAITALEAVED